LNLLISVMNSLNTYCSLTNNRPIANLDNLTLQLVGAKDVIANGLTINYQYSLHKR